MKGYESAFDLTLPARMPMIVRVDGKAFHSYTLGLTRPWDDTFISVMNDTAVALCEEIQGARLAYVQSDEISILLVDYAQLNTQAWMRGRLQKVVSVAAGLASSRFTWASWRMHADGMARHAAFDARAFVLPREDVNNYFLWRQQDATRNSMQMLARSLYSHKECFQKDNAELQEMCFQRGQNWNDLPTSRRRGRVVKRTTWRGTHDGPEGLPIYFERSRWEVDNEPPIFSQDPAYVQAMVSP
jgi:tRNA(His) 5'-end guanylyltransferase